MSYQSFRTVHELAEACGVFVIECHACRHRSFLFAHEVRQHHKATWRAGGRIEALRFRCSGCRSRQVTALSYRPAHIDSVPRKARTYGGNWPYPAPAIH